MTKEELYKVTDILNDVLSNYLRGSEAEEVIAKLEESVEDSELIKESQLDSPDFKIALEKKVREAQDWTYIKEEGGECPLNEEFGAYDLEEFAKWGANWQKEQLLAKAVDAVVKIDAGGYPYVDRTIELYDYDKDIPLAKRGDKVKILVIKES